MDWITMPAIAALIGWVTNFIAVRMIFRPHREVRFLGMKIHGLLPKRRREFAHSIGATVAEHLVSPDDIKRVMADPELKAGFDATIKAKIDVFLNEKLVAKMPMLAMFLKGPVADSIKEGLVTECRGMLDEGIEKLGGHLDAKLDLSDIVVKKIEAFDIQKLETIVVSVAKKELFSIEILGAILGAFVGLLQVVLLRVMSSGG